MKKSIHGTERFLIFLIAYPAPTTLVCIFKVTLQAILKRSFTRHSWLSFYKQPMYQAALPMFPFSLIDVAL